MDDVIAYLKGHCFSQQLEIMTSSQKNNRDTAMLADLLADPHSGCLREFKIYKNEVEGLHAENFLSIRERIRIFMKPEAILLPRKHQSDLFSGYRVGMNM